MNQCDGCQAGIPLDRYGNHRMGGMVKPDGTQSTYPNLQGCTAYLYVDTHICGVCQRAGLTTEHLIAHQEFHKDDSGD